MNNFRLTALLALAAGPVFGWGCEGHRTVALIALQQLTPNARAADRPQGQRSMPTVITVLFTILVTGLAALFTNDPLP